MALPTFVIAAESFPLRMGNTKSKASVQFPIARIRRALLSSGVARIFISQRSVPGINRWSRRFIFKAIRKRMIRCIKRRMRLPLKNETLMVRFSRQAYSISFSNVPRSRRPFKMSFVRRAATECRPYSCAVSIFRIADGGKHPGEKLAEYSNIEYQLLFDLLWLPDGSGFPFSNQTLMRDSANIFRYDFATRKVTQVTQLQNEFTGSFSISPDGPWIVFERSKSLDQNRAIDLWISCINGANARLLVRNAFSPPGTKELQRHKSDFCFVPFCG
jgi:hypothetical protein